MDCVAVDYEREGFPDTLARTSCATHDVRSGAVGEQRQGVDDQVKGKSGRASTVTASATITAPPIDAWMIKLCSTSL